MKLVYFGTPEMAVAPLQALCAAGHEVVLVVTGADTRRGRGSGVTPSPVKAAAVAQGLRVTEDPLDVLSTEADLGVVVAYGRLITAQILNHLSMVNLHFSLLPRWRGAAPVERAILAGDTQSGVCLMEVAEGLDTGGIYSSAVIDLDDQITAAELRERLIELGSELLVNQLKIGLKPPIPQATDGVTYAHKLHGPDAQLHWNSSTEDLLRIVRVGGAWSSFRHKRFKVLKAQATHAGAPCTELSESSDTLPPGTIAAPCAVRTGDSWLELLLVQPEGKAPMKAADWARGARPLGEVLE